MQKYKVLYLTLFPHIGGGETALLYLLEKLDRSRFDPIVLVTKEGQVSNRLRDMGVETHILDLPGFLIRTLFIPGMSPFGMLRFYFFVRKIRPHLIHLNHPFLAVYAGVVGKIFRIPVVATSHGLWDCVYPYQDLINAICVDRLLPITPDVQKALLKRGIVPKEKTKVIYLGVDTQCFIPVADKKAAKKKWHINEHHLVVTMACRFDFGKNHITFLKVAKDILTVFSDVTFVVVGDTKRNLETKNTMAQQVKQQLDNYLSSNSLLRDHVLFTDFQEDMAPVYHATDILFSSSLSETLPVSFLEGASSGLPLIALEVVSNKRIILHKKNGFLIPSEKPWLLSKYLLLLLRDEKLRKTFGKFSRDYVLKKFSLERYTYEIEVVYDQLLIK